MSSDKTQQLYNINREERHQREQKSSLDCPSPELNHRPSLKAFKARSREPTFPIAKTTETRNYKIKTLVIQHA